MRGTREERFWAKVEKTDECWLWKGAPGSHGYGELRTNGVLELAHRISWELAGRELIDGLTLDHKCHNRICVNPYHLEQVTRGENVLRGESTAAQHARKTHCDYGHEFTEENTYRWAKKNMRQCRICKRRRDAEWKQRRKEAA